MNRFDRVLRWTLYPATLLLSLLAYRLLQPAVPRWLAVVVPVLATSLLLMVLERWRPKTPDWQPSAKTFAVDVLHSLISTAGPPELIRALMFGALYAVGSQLAAAGAPVWPHHWPLGLQLLLALTLGEFGAYWVHRICHRWSFWWRIHALHHSADKLHMFASGRNHPFNVVLSYSAQVTPLLLLGINPDALALMSVFTGVHGMLQHCNVDLRGGMLNYLLSGPELHHFHHSKDLAESNTNFGSNLIVWDLVFGTFFLPADRRPGLDVGMTELTVRDNFWHQLAVPFIYHRLTAPAPEPAVAPAGSEADR